MKVAEYLESHPKVETVNYLRLKKFPQYKLAKKQMTDFSALMSFKLKTLDLAQIKIFFNKLEIFKIGVSWGSHENLVYAPAISYLKELSSKQFEGLGISLGNMRISVGLENAEDLINDLEHALNTIS